MRCAVICASLIAAIFLAGCASNKVDWGSRVGNYTYDQAVLELGPPDKVAELSDGTKVADWITRRSGYMQSGFLVHTGPFVHSYIDAPSPDYFLRLSFTPEGRLQSWKRGAR